MSDYYQCGNTVRFTAKFKDWDGQPVNPELVKIIFYNQQFVKINEYSISLDSILSPGEFYYDYTANSVGSFYYEFYGEIGGSPSLKRASFAVRAI